MKKAKILFIAAGLAALLPAMAAGHPPVVKSVVLVHGAWVDGSGWKPVADILTMDGYTVAIVQEPLTSFAEDVAAVRRIMDLQSGPFVLVGHSYGGSVITEAGTHSGVATLVYVAAHMPDAGESEVADGKRFPSDLAKSANVRKTPDNFNYIDPPAFPAYFAADLPKAQAEFAARSQTLTAAASFSGTITTPAWRQKPSWMVVAGADRIINPELERWYAKRAGSQTREIAGASHSVYESRPKEVAEVIEAAARAASK